MAKFNERFRLLREETGFSQQKIADDLDISRSTVGMYELGTREPNFETLEAIADYFNVDMDYLIGKSAIKRRVPSLSDFISVDHPILSKQDQRLLAYFSLLTPGMQDNFLNLLEATAKTLQQQPDVSHPTDDKPQ